MSTDTTHLATTLGDPGFARVAAVSLLIGSIGLVATSVCYALAGPEAALPGGGTGAEAIRLATSAGAGLMRAAGLIGMPSDVLLAVGGLMFAATRRGSGAGLNVAGWLAMAIAGVLFIVVDAMVAFVLPAAAQAGDGAAYAAMRSVFDVLFAIGALATAGGALAAAWSPRWPEYRWRAVLWSMRASAAVGLFGSLSYFTGSGGSRLIGPGIALLAVALAALSVSAMAASGSSPRASVQSRPGVAP